TGTTCFADMYFYADEVAGVAHRSNMRAQLASPVLDFPTAWAQNADEYINKATQIHDDYRSNDLISTAFGPHAPYTVSDESLTRIAALAEELDVPIHMHLHENAQEVTDAEATDGRRPLQRLRDLGIVSPRLLCVHATQLLLEEITFLSTHGASVIHCPSSNMKLASGFCKVDQLLRQGVNVALGTDGAASNNNLDMLSEMHLMAMIAKAVAQDAAAVNAQQALEIATLNGAKALGLDNEIGSLEIGKYADVCAVSLAPLGMTPVNNPLSHLVYASNGSYVSHVWVGGTPLLTDGELQTLDLSLVRDRAQYWQGQFLSQ
ncbi:MAG: amidohydrolase family protein, partial [Pseudomonadota bacterium]|nr:amidohydrolase family protein [Pseudomonadota bacterium]